MTPTPPRTIDLERRTTHKYAPGWDYLDQHEAVGTGTVLSCRKTHEDEDGHRETILLRVRSAEPKEHIADAIHDTMRHACRCEHDCCGHIQTSVSAARKLPRQNIWVVKLSATRNC